MNSREVAAHLFEYLRFLGSEVERASAISEITGSDATREVESRLRSRVEAVQEMANELWDLKVDIR